jgi:sulfonate transport system ATP-binding protein
LLTRVWRELGFTAVLVTHDVTEAVHLADRVIVLDEGRIKLDLAIPQAHPRRHLDPDLAALEGKLLSAILGES